MMKKIPRLRPQACSWVQRMLDHFLKGELSIETNQEILLHLEQCEGCQRERAHREAARRGLTAGWDSIPVPEGLSQRVQQGLQPGRRLRGWMVWAAALLLPLVLGAGAARLAFDPAFVDSWFSSGAWNHYQAVVTAHLRCHEKGMAESDQLVLPVAELERALGSGREGLKLETAHLCRRGALTFVHYVFSSGSRRLSVILEKRPGNLRLARPAAASFSRFGDFEVGFEELAGASVAFLESPHYFAYVVDESVSPESMHRIVAQLLSPLQSLFA